VIWWRPGALAAEPSLLSSDRARGLEVTIFNPRLDPDGSIARRLLNLIATSVLRRPAAGRARQHE
jgi:arginase family enzyme